GLAGRLGRARGLLRGRRLRAVRIAVRLRRGGERQHAQQQRKGDGQSGQLMSHANFLLLKSARRRTEREQSTVKAVQRPTRRACRLLQFKKGIREWEGANATRVPAGR